MEFLEFVLAFSVVVVLPLAALKAIIDYKKDRLQTEAGNAGVTAGELKRLLREVVEESNAPLLDRIDDLEDRLQPNALSQELGDEYEPQERTLGRRVAE